MNTHSGWDRELMYELAFRSWAEYQDDPAPILRRFREPEDFTVFRDTEIEHSVATYPEHHLLTFRGTEPKNLQDWMTDFKIIRRRMAGVVGTWHRGMLGAIREIFDTVMPYVSDGKPVITTGHSLGGGLATIFSAACLSRRGPRLKCGATFGSPRCANRKAADWFSQAIEEHTVSEIGWWRVVNNNDIITRVPFSVRGGYRHVGKLAYIEHDGDIVFDPGRWHLFRDRVKGRFEGLDGGEPTVHEVPGIKHEVAERLVGLGMGKLRQVARVGVATLMSVSGVGPVAAAAITAWAEHRMKGKEFYAEGFVFDGTHDHGSRQYVDALSID